MKRSGLLAVVMVCACASVGAATADGATVYTFGAEINQSPITAGTCGFEHSTERPCVFVDNTITSQAGLLTAPCNGTITRFRLNGIPRPGNSYSLRVLDRNGDGSYTGTATSAPVEIATEGINEYASSLPVSKGESIGIDFDGSTEEHGLFYVSEAGVSSAVLFAFPADGTPAFPNIPSTGFYYLYDADVECAAGSAPLGPPATTPAPAPAPVAPTPSNSFTVVGLKKATVILNLASAGQVTVTEATAKKKKVAAGGKSAALLRPSSATGGPGRTRLKLALTAAAKAKLRETGKVRIRASLAFTPTGGTTALQTRSFTVKGKVNQPGHS
ncbi:MAG TPA: hypothetical protein VMF55_03040 [Solirubrobacterales bacterium]|nr:hypothetical protein [Solirubrobacterales bacterium]